LTNKNNKEVKTFNLNLNYKKKKIDLAPILENTESEIESVDDDFEIGIEVDEKAEIADKMDRIVKSIARQWDINYKTLTREERIEIGDDEYVF
jgi:hypothetical protein